MVRGLYEVKYKGRTNKERETMAGYYGVQFEALMKEVCVDFGRRLIRGWDEEADKDEVASYVKESVEAFFKKAKGLEVTIEAEKIEEEPKKKSAKKPRVSKKKAEKPDSPSGLTDTEEEKPKKSKLARSVKKGGVEKKKCEGVTAKGAQCSKCAVEGEVFCSIHLKKKGEASGSVVEKKNTKKKVSKKEEAPVHSHEIGEKPSEEEGCEVCEKYGEVFEVPEYEEEKEKEDEDPDWTLREEDFDEDEDV